jgi:biotin synthase
MFNLRFQHEEILAWLAEQDPQAIETLFAAADKLRAATVGPQVHLRALVEISNHCVRQCGYCGIRAGRPALPRYRMDAAEILDCARRAAAMGYGTVVLQAGEDPGITSDWMADIVRQIKGFTPLAVTLSLGERSTEELAAWRQSGADRYLLRFETSDLPLFHRIHPPLASHPERPNDRIAMLRGLRALGYEIGSGIMVGIPGQSLSSIAADVLLFRELDLDMIGVGPYIAHPDTPLGAEKGSGPSCAQHPSSRSGKLDLTPFPRQRAEGQERDAAPSPLSPLLSPLSQQAPGDEWMVSKVIALARLACPEANIPSTTALATINPRNGRELGLQRGANVVMPNLTPLRYRALYEIYPNKACLAETGEQCNRCLAARIAAIGRTVGHGPGGRRRI